MGLRTSLSERLIGDAGQTYDLEYEPNGNDALAYG